MLAAIALPFGAHAVERRDFVADERAPFRFRNLAAVRDRQPAVEAVGEDHEIELV